MRVSTSRAVAHNIGEAPGYRREDDGTPGLDATTYWTEIFRLVVPDRP
jgi:hypothetical protein